MTASSLELDRAAKDARRNDVRRNLTLARMADADFAALSAHLEHDVLQRGQTVTAQGEPVECVYFPVTAHFANMVTFSDGRSAETFIMGVEGVTGLAPFLADEPCAWSIEVKRSGEAYRISAEFLRSRAENSTSLRRQLNRLTSDYQSQASVNVACAALHDVPSRLATYLIALAEREQTGHFELTQQDLAGALGAQRTTINAAAAQLKATGAIRYIRGKLDILDERALRQTACECLQLRPSTDQTAAVSPDPEMTVAS